MHDLIPLPVLLSHVLHAFARDYGASVKELPSLPVLNNVLRVVGSRGVNYKDLGKRCVLSDRVVRISTRVLENYGWLTIKQSDADTDKVVRVTPAGKSARTRGLRRQTTIEREWEDHFGSKRIRYLRSALAPLVAQIDVQLPHYIASYGQGDPSITGGGYIPADPGPPIVPAHGGEWPVVLRESRDLVAELPLTALLSQTLAAFTIDFDDGGETVMGGLHGVLTFLRSLSSNGMPLSEASKIADVNGTGRAGLERHGLVTVIAEPSTRGKQRTVVLTALGKRVCRRYPARVVDVERLWRSKFGSKVVESLRSAVESIDERLDGDFPDYPETRDWIRQKKPTTSL